MQRRDPRTFLEGVLAQVTEIPDGAHAELLALVGEKAGTKRAQKIAAIIAAVGSPAASVSTTEADDD